MKAWNNVPNIKVYEYMYLPLLLALPPPAARAKSSPLYTLRRGIERQPAVHIINGWFVTAARMFQRAKGYAVLLPIMLSVGARKESPPSRSLWPCPLHLLPQNTTAPTLKLVTSNRKGQVLPPIHFRRGIEGQPAIHKNGWFVTSTRTFQRAEGCAVLYYCCLILVSVVPLPQNTTSSTLELATSNRMGQVLPPIHFRRSIERQPAIHINGWLVTAACINIDLIDL